MRQETIEAITARARRPGHAPSASDAARKRFCWHCDREIVSERAGPGWRLGVPALVIAVFASVTIAVLAGPFVVLALVPLLLFAAALGPYFARMREVASCPRCGREVPYLTREQAYAAHGGSKWHDGAHVPPIEKERAPL